MARITRQADLPSALGVPNGEKLRRELVVALTQTKPRDKAELTALLTAASGAVAASGPQVPTLTGIARSPAAVTVAHGATATVSLSPMPGDADLGTVTVASSDATKATGAVAAGVLTVTGVAAGAATLTLTSGTVTATVAVTVS